MSKRVGRPSKIDKDTMRDANIGFILIIIILLILLFVATLSIVSPSTYESLKASIINLFK